MFCTPTVSGNTHSQNRSKKKKKAIDKHFVKQYFHLLLLLVELQMLR